MMHRVMWEINKEGAVFVLFDELDGLVGQSVAKKLPLGALRQRRDFVR